MRNRHLPTLNSSLLTWAMRRARRGDADSKTVIIIALMVVTGVSLLCCGGMALIMLPGIQRAREAARRAQASNNLQNIGIALHNYQDVYNMFPPGGIYGEDGADHHSWQAMLLPYVDQAKLYNQIDFDRPWDDPVNSSLFSTVIPMYQHPSAPDAPLNTQGLALTHFAGNSQIFAPNLGTRFSDVTDGLTNTAIVGDVAAGFKPWGDPTNVRDPSAGIAIGPETFSGPAAQNGTLFLMGDGAVRFLDNSVSQQVLDAIATPDGGEVVPQF